eukprot:scaffold36473_cov72-Phaeocystis_antarctica.AAC.1
MASIALLLPPVSIVLSGRRVSTMSSKLTIASESPDWRPLLTKKVRVCFITAILGPRIEPERSTTATISSGSLVFGSCAEAASEIIASVVCTSPAQSASFSAETLSVSAAGAIAAGASTTTKSSIGAAAVGTAESGVSIV